MKQSLQSHEAPKQFELFDLDTQIPTRQIARAIDWTPNYTRKFFARVGLAHQFAPHTEWYVSRHALRDFAPQLERSWREALDRGLFAMPGRARHGAANGNRREARSRSQHDEQTVIPVTYGDDA